MLWHGMVRYGTVWYGMVWYGMVRYGMVSSKARGQVFPLHRPVPTSGAPSSLRGDAGAGGDGGQRRAVQGGCGQARAREGFGERLGSHVILEGDE